VQLGVSPVPAPRVVVPAPTGAVLGTTSTADRPAAPSLLLVVALCLAIGCFACGATPADHIPWRRGAFLLASRRTAVIVAGGVFLLAAAFVLATR
jgi:hypothetical protein